MAAYACMLALTPEAVLAEIDALGAAANVKVTG
jgi:hypothetical protein